MWSPVTRSGYHRIHFTSPEVRGYQFFESVSDPYPQRTICIRTFLQIDIRIRSVFVTIVFHVFKGYLAFSFLCTSRERKVHRVNFRSRGTFALLELSLLRSECSKNFRSVEPLLHKQLSCPLTFAPVELSLIEDIVDVNVSLLLKRCVDQ